MQILEMKDKRSLEASISVYSDIKYHLFKNVLVFIVLTLMVYHTLYNFHDSTSRVNRSEKKILVLR